MKKQLFTASVLAALFFGAAMVNTGCQSACPAKEKAPAKKAAPKKAAPKKAAPKKVWKALTVTVNKTYLPVGSTAKFVITLEDIKNQPIANAKVRILTDGNPAVRKSRMMVTDKNGKINLSLPVTRPGTVYCRATYQKHNDAAAVATDIYKVTPGLPEPADFKAYWDKVRAEMDARPMDAVLTPVKSTRNVYARKVKLPMGGEGKDAYAILTIPAGAKPKSLPIRVLLHGANTDKISPLSTMSHTQNVIALNLNPMPVDNNGKQGDFCRRGKYKGYFRWNPDDREKIFYNGMFRRIYRALQFVKTLPEWDGKTLIVSGVSQGGGQALAAGGLDPAVSCVVAMVPAICNHGGRAKGDAGWPQFFVTKEFKKDPAKVLYASSYIDAVNFARYINPKADCFVTTGLIDRTCPPESVFAAFNVIPAKNKVLSITPEATHSVPKNVRAQSEKFIADHIKKAKSAK